MKPNFPTLKLLPPVESVSRKLLPIRESSEPTQRPQKSRWVAGAEPGLRIRRSGLMSDAPLGLKS
jgi:hypothetical protein